MLKAVGKYAQGTNMGLERLLNLIKRATPPHPRKPRATRIISGGVVTQYMRNYLDKGRADNRGQMTRATLVKRGVPVRATRAKREKATSSGIKWHVRWANAKLTSNQVRLGDGSEETLRSRCAKEWKDP